MDLTFRILPFARNNVGRVIRVPSGSKTANHIYQPPNGRIVVTGYLAGRQASWSGTLFSELEPIGGALHMIEGMGLDLALGKAAADAEIAETEMLRRLRDQQTAAEREQRAKAQALQDAAPDMLAALEAALPALEAFNMTTMAPGTALQTVRAAIKKAKGE